LPSDGSASSHAVRIAYGFHAPVCSRVSDFSRFGRLNTIAHSPHEVVGLLKNAVHVLEFNVVSGSIIIKCRDIFVAQQKSIGNGGQLRCFPVTILLSVLMIIPVAVINGRPRTMFTLNWSPVTTTKEVGHPSLVRYGR
jgi:hypothetical protein